MNWKAAGLFLLLIATLMGYVGLVATACNFIEDTFGIGWAIAAGAVALITPAVVFIGVTSKDDE